MATHAGRLTAAVRVRRPARAASRPDACSTASTSTSRRASSSRCSGRSGSGKSTLLRALAGLDHDVDGSGEHRRARTRSRWSSRTPGCCRGNGCWTTSSSACPGRRAAARPRGAGRGRARRPRAGLAARAVRRRAAARRAGPVAGARAGAAAGRRAVRRAGRADPASACTACCASCARGTGPPCCWSPTTSTRRSCSPTGCSCSTTGGSRSTSRRARRRPVAPRPGRSQAAHRAARRPRRRRRHVRPAPDTERKAAS